MKFIDWFAGIGGFRRGMELAGHECVGFCEFDKYAYASYVSMHLLTDEQRKELSKLDFSQRQKEIISNDKYRNGEWYSRDIRRTNAEDIPESDCWCFGFPCQDISVAGKQLGFKGNRSSLFFRVMYLLGQLEEKKKPTWLFIENVKNLLSVNGGWDFAKLLVELDEGGYDAEWEILNSKDFGVPQNRERCFIIGHLRGIGGREIFPLTKDDRPPNELQGHHDLPKLVAGTLDTRIEALTNGTYPMSGGGYCKSERSSLQRGLITGIGKPNKFSDVANTLISTYNTIGQFERTYIIDEDKTSD